jgi:hypothetical protein
MKNLLDDITLALMANNGSHVTDFQSDMCECDPSVGMCPCQYCAIHYALKRCESFFHSHNAQVEFKKGAQRNEL